MKTKTTKLPKGYTLKGNYELTGTQKPFPTRKLENGSTIIINGNHLCDNADAFDSNGRWLGLFSSATPAEKGYCADFQEKASELSTWLLWNDATQHHTSVLEDDNGSQIIMISYFIYLRASKDHNGWNVEWLSREEIDSQYNNGKCLKLKHANKIFVLQ